MAINSILKDKTFEVVTLGCRTNHYEAEAIASMLEARGARYRKFQSGGAPDILVLVTCSITAVADAKARKLIRRLRRRHPAALLVATGCFVQGKEDEEVLGLGVDVSVGNRLKATLPQAIEAWFESRNPSASRIDVLRREVHWDDLRLDRPRIHTRAFVKVQEGCSRACSYCIVPSVRGPQVSRDPREVVREVAEITASGCREIVLTGIHLGGYRHERAMLADLIAGLAAVPGLERLRLGSIEPFSIDDRLLSALAGLPAFCPHVHVPLQSGDDEILKRMRRGHTAADFVSTIRRIRAALGDDAHLSTDLIVGFPGEDEAAFERSLALIGDLGFGKIHVFPFSPRAGTPAAVMTDAVSRDQVKQRVARAGAFSAELLAKYAERWVSRSDTVMIEYLQEMTDVARPVATGWTRHYLKSYFQTACDKVTAGDIVTFVPKSTVRGILRGDGLTASFAPLDDDANGAI